MPRRDRAVVVRGEEVIKLYDRPEDAAREYSVFLAIHEAVPRHFRVPKPLAIAEVGGRAAIVMERVKGTPLTRYVVRASAGERGSLKVLFSVGRALRELHSMRADLPRCGAATTGAGMAEEVLRSLEWVCAGGLRTLLCGLLRRYVPRPEHFLSVGGEILVDSLVHGEFYPSHVFIEDDSAMPVFIDFGFSCAGPAYIDLTMFVVSSFIASPIRLSVGLDSVRSPFLLGYFGSLPEGVDASLRIAEAYMALRVLRDSLMNAGRGIRRAAQAALAMHFLRLRSWPGGRRW